MKQPAIYILANRKNGALYTGVTNDLFRRVYEHRTEMYESFTAKYKCKKLVYYEMYENIAEAIVREKQIKAGSRKKKIDLIHSMNPSWQDLYNEIVK